MTFETTPPLLQKIEAFLRETGMAATSFGRRTVRDPRFVLDLRNGRSPSGRTCSTIEHFMNKYRRDRAGDIA